MKTGQPDEKGSTDKEACLGIPDKGGVLPAGEQRGPANSGWTEETTKICEIFADIDDDGTWWGKDTTIGSSIEIREWLLDILSPALERARQQGHDEACNLSAHDKWMREQFAEVAEKARKEERERIEKEIDEIQNPYPEDIFRPLTIEQRKKAGDILLENNYTPDAVFGDWGRQVFLNTLKKVKAALRGGKE